MHPLLEFLLKLLMNGFFALILWFILVGSLLSGSIGLNQFKDSNIIIKILIFCLYGIFNWPMVFVYFVILCKLFDKCVPLEEPFPF